MKNFRHALQLVLMGLALGAGLAACDDDDGGAPRPGGSGGSSGTGGTGGAGGGPTEACPSLAPTIHTDCTNEGQSCTYGSTSPPDPCPPGQSWGSSVYKCQQNLWAVTYFDGVCPGAGGAGGAGGSGGSCLPYQPPQGACVTEGERCVYGSTSQPENCSPNTMWGYTQYSCQQGTWRSQSYDFVCSNTGGAGGAGGAGQGGEGGQGGG